MGSIWKGDLGVFRIYDISLAMRTFSQPRNVTTYKIDDKMFYKSVCQIGEDL